MAQLYDMHCHLGFSSQPAALAREAGALGVGALSLGVEPADYERSRLELGECPNVTLGLGLHPWWVADCSCGQAEIARFEELAGSARFVGEVGLDFAPRREGTFEAQLAAFERVARACADGSRLLSIHAVRSAATVLDVLEAHGLTRSCTCILHWFSGSSEELARAVRLGCWFSLGTRSLATKRGRAYARAIPTGRLLLESDLPDEPGAALDAQTWHDDLAAALEALEQALDRPMADELRANSELALATGA